ncbi:DNA-processing protein DprA [Hyphobacterium sp. HN65]|uniref:DNA-processing protein DprA n=1 Tax=Hyphobacterium lacteum TaxID=3116575 RepID=A0ABU7LMG6_9PROT|nr:DNA-processing protein DprA [Hyphobacterium sp. HN65]MEE2525125.1 DNA-processing protein DprA [Hyphobacterium sp. HN65]
MKRGELSFPERIDWLRLARTAQVGPVTFNKLIDRYGDAACALDALPELARKGGRRGAIKIVSRDEAEQEMAASEDYDARIIMACEPDFPDLLFAIDPPPPVITVKGHLTPDDAPCCAIVGSRNASAIGMRFARDMAAELGRSGITIVSGLARGIDGAAHSGSLATGTIAVLAGGIDHIYPPEHAELHAAIARDGLLVTESRLGATPTAKDFPRRNRLISGLSLGTLVIEAAMRSGSLITARLAAEQGREVMAAPGSPLDPRAKGSNKLIRDGAVLIETADDVLDVLRHAKRPVAAESDPQDYTHDALPETGPAARERVLDLLSPSPVAIDDLVRHSGLATGEVHAVLIELEIAGRAVILPGGTVQLGYEEAGD